MGDEDTNVRYHYDYEIAYLRICLLRGSIKIQHSASVVPCAYEIHWYKVHVGPMINTSMTPSISSNLANFTL